jgi:hypothetical protein
VRIFCFLVSFGGQMGIKYAYSAFETTLSTVKHRIVSIFFTSPAVPPFLPPFRRHPPHFFVLATDTACLR